MIQDPAPRSTSARCSRCGEVVGPNDRFCPACGAPRWTVCPTCGAAADGQERRCPECGGPLPVPAPVLGAADRRDRQVWWNSRGFRLLVGAAACLLVVFAAVAWVYFSSPDRQKDRPISQISAQSPTLAVQPGKSPLALIGTASGLLTSDDQGSTWRKLLLEGGVKAIGSGPSDSAPIYLAGARFWRGDSRGFQQVATDLPIASVQALAVDPVDSNRVYAIVAGQGLYRSDDGGARWARLGTEVPAGVTGLALVGGEHPLFFVATSEHGIFGSVDGRSWSNANGFVNGALPTQTVLALAYDPHSGDRYVNQSGEATSGALYAGTDLGLFKSIDGGLSWSPLPFHHPVAALGVSPGGDHLMLAVDPNGGVYRSIDGGVSWH